MGDDNTTTPKDDLKRLIGEYRLMFRYANAAGLLLDDKTQAAMIAVGADPGNASFADLMAAHSALTRIVAPATPLSLEATEPAGGQFGRLLRPALVFWMMVIAIVAGIGFAWTEIDVEEAPPITASSTQSQTSTVSGANPSASNQATNPAGATATPSGTNAPATVTSHTTASQSESTDVTAAMVINWCCAAALGAVFYVLFTALQYVNNRTFDPAYNTVYVIRFVLGVLSGLILAALIGQSNFAKGNAQIMSLGPAVLALLRFLHRGRLPDTAAYVRRPVSRSQGGRRRRRAGQGGTGRPEGTAQPGRRSFHAAGYEVEGDRSGEEDCKLRWGRATPSITTNALCLGAPGPSPVGTRESSDLAHPSWLLEARRHRFIAPQV